MAVSTGCGVCGPGALLFALVFGCLRLLNGHAPGLAPPLSIFAGSRPGLYRRTRQLAARDRSLPALLGGTAARVTMRAVKMHERHGCAPMILASSVLTAPATATLVAIEVMTSLIGTASVFVVAGCVALVHWGWRSGRLGVERPSAEASPTSAGG